MIELAMKRVGCEMLGALECFLSSFLLDGQLHIERHRLGNFYHVDESDCNRMPMHKLTDNVE